MEATMRLLLLLSILAVSCSAAQYNVGGSQGWTDPSKSNVSYSSWALQHRYHVGDTLVFNFADDSHSVLEVNRQAFDSCNSQSSLASYTQDPTTVKLSTPGPHWFISGEENHCSQGQKFGIMVAAQRRGGHHGKASAPAPAPSSVFPAEAPASTLQAPAPSHGAAFTTSANVLLAAAAAVAAIAAA